MKEQFYIKKRGFCASCLAFQGRGTERQIVHILVGRNNIYMGLCKDCVTRALKMFDEVQSKRDENEVQ